MLKKYLTLLLLACTALVSVPSLAQLSDSEAMNMAGLQRSLGQRERAVLLDRNQAVLLANYLYELTGQSKPQRRTLLQSLFGK